MHIIFIFFKWLVCCLAGFYQPNRDGDDDYDDGDDDDDDDDDDELRGVFLFFTRSLISE